MKTIIVKGGIVLAILLALSTLQSCFKMQKTFGCNNTGIFGCKDQPSEIQPPDQELRRAPPGGRVPPRPDQQGQAAEVATGRYLEGHEYPWSQPLDDCMAAGGLRTECFENLPPDILAQFEAWEAERAAMRRRQFEQRSRAL